MTAQRSAAGPAQVSSEQPGSGRPVRDWAAGRSRRERAFTVLRPLIRLGPFMIVLVVGKALLDYLPESLSGDAARYSVAGSGAIAAGSIVALTTSLIQRRTVDDEDPRISTETGECAAELLEMAQRELLGCCASVADPTLGVLVGWSHFVEEAREGIRPTAIGTAYGLKSCLLIDPAGGRPEYAALCETLWRLQLPDEGWAARTQSGVGRPEVTALVLGVLGRSSGNSDRLADAVSAFERILTEEADPVGMSRTYVAAASLCGLVRICPGSARLAELRRMLVTGATRDPKHENLLCWADQLADGRRSGLVPSIPHTARAIVALSRAARTRDPDGQAESTVKEGIRWLVSQGALARQTEQIRRTLDDRRYESVTVRHFTSALVARALMCPEARDVENRDALLIEAVREVWSSQHGGLWEWDNGEHPLWMTYQGLSVLHGYALHAGKRPG
jgi:hypothetical protein